MTREDQNKVLTDIAKTLNKTKSRAAIAEEHKISTIAVATMSSRLRKMGVNIPLQRSKIDLDLFVSNLKKTNPEVFDPKLVKHIELPKDGLSRKVYNFVKENPGVTPVTIAKSFKRPNAHIHQVLFRGKNRHFQNLDGRWYANVQ